MFQQEMRFMNKRHLVPMYVVMPWLKQEAAGAVGGGVLSGAEHQEQGPPGQCPQGARGTRRHQAHGSSRRVQWSQAILAPVLLLGAAQ